MVLACERGILGIGSCSQGCFKCTGTILGNKCVAPKALYMNDTCGEKDKSVCGGHVHFFKGLGRQGETYGFCGPVKQSDNNTYVCSSDTSIPAPEGAHNIEYEGTPFQCQLK